jgi:hypothetical protein
MKSFICLIVFLIGFSQIYSQSPDPFIEGLVNQTNLDSLVYSVRVLSGEDPVIVGGTTVLIRDRSSNVDNNLAADYIKQKLISYGLDTYDQTYGGRGNGRGNKKPRDRNIYAIQPGILYPDEQYIICAHYDAVTDYCADDNASGTAAVLEAARILSNYQLDYTLIYALWDEEETGYTGSEYYADQAFSINDNILGVINLDMLGWDGDDDGLMDIHTSNIANSVSLANLVSNIISLYNLSLTPVIHNPGATNSDHNSFWDVGYGAIVFSEVYWGDDFNPYYHTSGDRIDKFNLAYFHELAKLAIGSISSLANGVPIPDTTLPRVLQAALVDESTVDVLYSEPVIGAANFSNYEIDGPQSITVTSAVYNNMVATLSTSEHTPGDYTISVSNVVDIAGNVIDPDFNTAAYTMEGLPAVVMSYFRAAPLNGNVVTLEWETLSENGNLGWDIEESKKNTNNFNAIDFVEGAGTSNTPIQYFFNTSLNKYGKYYYRLKQKSSDGSFSYSDNVFVNYKRTRNAALTSYPNPFNPQSTVAVYVDKKQLVTINVYNMIGQLAKTLFDGIAEEGEMNFTFNGLRLSSGAYVVVMQTESSIINHKILLLK